MALRQLMQGRTPILRDVIGGDRGRLNSDAVALAAKRGEAAAAGDILLDPIRTSVRQQSAVFGSRQPSIVHANIEWPRARSLRSGPRPNRIGSRE
jgi:hypothetical protein